MDVSAAAMVAASAHQRQLILAIEGTAALGQSWNLLRVEYLEEIIRSFRGSDAVAQKASNSYAELALVVFYSHGPHSPCLVHKTGWTSNLEVFFKWISSINFAGGGFGEAAIAEGLVEALLMYYPTPITTSVSQVGDKQKHCILVTASNPHRLPTPVPRPPIPNLMQPGTNTEPSAAEHWWLADADAVAKVFPQCSVSLSVISPRQLPSLKSIFNVAKRNVQVADSQLDVSKFSHHMVLISENFMEAYMSLTHTGNVTAVPPIGLPKMEAALTASISASGPAPITLSARSVTSGMTVSRAGVTTGIMPPVTIKTESLPISAVSSILQNPLSMSHSSSSQESILQESTTTQDLKPMISGSAPAVRSGINTANGSLTMNLSQPRPIISTTTGTSLGVVGGTSTSSGLSMLSSNSSNAVSTASNNLGIMQNGLGLQNNQMNIGSGIGMSQPMVTVGFSNANNVGGNGNIGTVPAGTNANNMQVVGMGVGQGTTQNASGGLTSNHNVLPSLGQMGTNQVSAPTMIPTPGISQPVQSLQQVSTIASNSLQVPGSVATPPQQAANAAARYAKIWDGILIGQRQEKAVFICKLEAFRHITSPETLAADWPKQMQVLRLINQDHMNNKNYHGKAEILIFRTLGQQGQQGFLVQLAENKLCAVIQLPTQTLLLASTDAKKQDRMLGMLFPRDMVVFRPQITSQQIQQQQQQQQLQQQQQQQQQQLQQQQQHQQQQQQHHQQHQQLQQQQLQQQQQQLQQQQQQQQLQQQQLQQQQQQQLLQQQQQPLQQQQQLAVQGSAPLMGQAFSSQGQLVNQARPQILQSNQLQGQAPGSGFLS